MSSLSKKATLIKGSLMTYLASRMAADAKLPLDPFLDGITNENYGRRKSALCEDIKTALRGRLARDADVRDLPQLLTALDQVEEPEDDTAGINAEPSVLDFLAARLSPSDLAEFKRLCRIPTNDESMTQRLSAEDNLSRPDRAARFTGAQDEFHARFPDSRRIGIV
jgi:hypothetical protein